MRRKFAIWVLGLVGSLTLCPLPAMPQTAADERPAYRLGAGDVLDVVVWKEPDFSAAGVAVRGDGKISLPFLKEVAVGGMTPSEAESMLGARLRDFVKAPEVSIVVKQLNSEKVYVMGAVNKPGPITLQGPITVLQALSAAGGLGPFAKKRKIYVLREVNGKPKQLPFNYDLLLKGEGFQQNIALLPNDTVIVP